MNITSTVDLSNRAIIVSLKETIKKYKVKFSSRAYWRIGRERAQDNRNKARTDKYPWRWSNGYKGGKHINKLKEGPYNVDVRLSKYLSTHYLIIALILIVFIVYVKPIHYQLLFDLLLCASLSLKILHTHPSHKSYFPFCLLILIRLIKNSFHHLNLPHVLIIISGIWFPLWHHPWSAPGIRK